MPADVSELLALADDLGKTGRKVKYRVGKTVKDTTEKVRASAAARAPKLTGTLAGSITASVRGLTGVVEAGAPYAIFQEFGTAHNAPQPFMTPAADEADGTFPPAVEEAVIQALGL